ncbi:MAG: acylphosphatase [Bacteroidales bacterium]|nr:acylphosphatase [Bacteroidales bacterium]
MPCYKIQITGSVFKTGFRYFLKEKAETNGITGRIYYENSLSVGIKASGSEEQLKRFLEFCSIGNRFYHIDRMEVTEVPPEDYSTFEVEDEPAHNNH